MKNKTIYLNPKVNGKQPSKRKRWYYYGGGKFLHNNNVY